MQDLVINQPVTAIISHRVRPGRELGYEQWLKGISAVAQTFPGHQGVSFVRPQGHECPEYVIILRFDTYAHLDAWMKSPERRTWIERASPLVEQDQDIQILTGLETWFNFPGQRFSPPVYKMAVVTWLGVQIVTSVVAYSLGPVLAPFPLWVNLAISNVIVVLALTYLVMPKLTQLLHFWLYSGRKH
jgi:antibiotic biosynthesis monooxygenase (ABM) superfamily enzyme